MVEEEAEIARKKPVQKATKGAGSKKSIAASSKPAGPEALTVTAKTDKASVGQQAAKLEAHPEVGGTVYLFVVNLAFIYAFWSL